MASFDPFSIVKFSVVRVPYRFEGQHLLEKYFVVLGHWTDGSGDSYAIAVKATSGVAVYLNNQEKMRGCVFYRGGQLPCFPCDTVIQPDNQIPLAHKMLADVHFDGGIQCWPLPPDFEAIFRAAVANSISMDKKKKQRLIAVLDA